MSGPVRLPWHLRLIASALSEADRTALVSELDEMVRVRRERHGDDAADRWLRREGRRASLHVLGMVLPWSKRSRPFLVVDAADSSHADPWTRSPSVSRSISQDVRYAVRTLRKRPGFLVTVVLTLGIGIGATTTIFSLVNGILLRPLQYEQSSNLVALGMGFGDDPHRLAGVSVPNFRDWRDRSATLETLGGASWVNHVVVGDGAPERIPGARVTEDFFATLRVGPQLGRLFTVDDFATGAPVAAISHGLWQRRFGGDREVLGRTIRTREASFTVVGVTPAGFSGPEGLSLDHLDVWTPLVPSVEEASRRGMRGLVVFGRKRPDASLDAIRAEFAAIGMALAEAYPDANYDREGRPWNIGVNPLQEQTVHSMGQPLMILLGAVGMLLLIGCVNVANLFLARGTERTQELSVRTALGAGRGRIIRQLLTESTIVALTGGLVGVGLAFLGVEAFTRFATPNVPRLSEVSVDLRMLSFAAALSLGAGLLFGLVPAIQASRIDPGDALKGAGRSTPGRGSHRLRRALVAIQTALAVILLTGSGLLFNSLMRMHRVETGFDPDRVLAARLTLDAKYPSDETRLAFWDQLRERVAALPGVESAAVVLNVPFQGTNERPSVIREGMAREDWIGIDANPVSAGYFETIGLDVQAGRAFTEDDGRGAPVTIVNTALAGNFWPGASAVGERIQLLTDGEDTWHTVIGVVNDHKQNGLDSPYDPMIYVPLAQMAWHPRLHIIARTAGDPAGLAAALRQRIWSIDPGLPVPSIEVLRERVSASVAEPTFYAGVLSLFAWIALTLAAVGVYGTMAYVAGQRTHEMGLRLALGAPASAVKGLLVRQEMRVIVVGLGAGVGGALLLSRFLSRFMYEVSPTDPATLASAAVVLGVVALVACYLPARRAARVDPVSTLRD